MKIYSLQFSEDGLGLEVYTNVKAINDGINKYTAYKPVSIYVGREEIKYNYTNLIKAIKIQSNNGKYYARIEVNCQHGYTIVITEHKIIK